MKRTYLTLGDYLIPHDTVRHVDISRIEDQIVTVQTTTGAYEARGFDAVEVVMQCKPSALEGRRLKWRQNAWAFHNIAGHVGLQILVWLGMKKLGVRWHDFTAPAPRKDPS